MYALSQDEELRLAPLADKLPNDADTAALTVHQGDRPVLAILRWDAYESLRESAAKKDALEETHEILADPEELKGLIAGLQDLYEGRVHRWDDVKAQLGL